jgi:hypothetical protein
VKACVQAGRNDDAATAARLALDLARDFGDTALQRRLEALIDDIGLPPTGPQ